MAEEYKQLTLKERKEIEKGLTRGDSFREIAPLSEGGFSTIADAVRLLQQTWPT